MRTSEKTEELYAALSAAQAELKDPAVNAENDHFKSKYTTLDVGLAIIRPVLTGQGLFYTQGQGHHEHLGAVLLTRIIHTSGQWQETDYQLGAGKDVQKQASANTYARRHALFAAVGVAPAGDDSDGEGALDRVSDKEKQALMAEGRAWAMRQWLMAGRDDFSGRSFASDLRRAKVAHSLEHIKLWRIWAGREKPSRLDGDKRAKLVEILASGKADKSWAKFVKECGPLPEPKAKKEKKKAEPEPKGEPEAEGRWSKAQEAAFCAGLAALDYQLDEVERYLVAHDTAIPADMSEGARAECLKRLATDDGSETVTKWLAAHPAEGADDGEE